MFCNGRRQQEDQEQQQHGMSYVNPSRGGVFSETPMSPLDESHADSDDEELTKATDKLHEHGKGSDEDSVHRPGQAKIKFRRTSSAPEFSDGSYRKYRLGEFSEYLWKRGKYLRVRCYCCCCRQWLLEDCLQQSSYVVVRSQRWKKRWFVLNGRHLSYFKDENGMQLGEVRKLAVAKRLLNLQWCTKDLDKSCYCFVHR